MKFMNSYHDKSLRRTSLASGGARFDRRGWLGRLGFLSLVGLSTTSGYSPAPSQPALEAPASPENSKLKGLRLTLRVLLAFRDKILDPDDMDDIRERLRASQFATQFNARIDAALRLHADDLTIAQAHSMPDPNLVAEYLDNTIGDSQATGYELMYLENDPPLAEVAACHEILAALLDQPVVTDWRNRERVQKRIQEFRSMGHTMRRNGSTQRAL